MVVTSAMISLASHSRFVCVCGGGGGACVRACVRVRVCACVCVYACVHVDETHGVTWFTFVIITCTMGVCQHCILLYNSMRKINY